MRCATPIRVKPKTEPVLPIWHNTPRVVTVPCGQCLPCRLRKRDCWAGRVLLEKQSSLCSQFWTLTFSDDTLRGLDWDQATVQRLMKNFCSALRMHEKRKGNPTKVRFFGTLEYAPVTSRPHIHLAVFNALSLQLYATSWTKGLERLPFHIGPWPHGHVDAQPMEIGSARYIAKYITKFEVETDLARPQWRTFPQGPPLGFIGLRQQLEMISRSPLKNKTQEALVQADGGTFPMDARTKTYWLELTKELGLKTPPALPHSWYAKRDEIAARDADERALRPNLELIRQRRFKELHDRFELGLARKERQERAELSRLFMKGMDSGEKTV